MESEKVGKRENKKRTKVMLPSTFQGSFSDKDSFYVYFSENL